MVEHLFASFLEDRSQYAGSVRRWLELWNGTDAAARRRDHWTTPWLSTTEEDGLGDGNPIFSAWSPKQRRGIRVIQHVPTRDIAELAWWLDTFAGPIRNPDCVEELVIACAMSLESMAVAQGLIEQWITRGRISRENPLAQSSSSYFSSVIPLAYDPEPAAV